VQRPVFSRAAGAGEPASDAQLSKLLYTEDAWTVA
jgi:hypothetical protein